MMLFVGCFIGTVAVAAVSLEATVSAACLGVLAFTIIKYS